MKEETVKQFVTNVYLTSILSFATFLPLYVHDNTNYYPNNSIITSSCEPTDLFNLPLKPVFHLSAIFCQPCLAHQTISTFEC